MNKKFATKILILTLITCALVLTGCGASYQESDSKDSFAKTRADRKAAKEGAQAPAAGN